MGKRCQVPLVHAGDYIGTEAGFTSKQADGPEGAAITSRPTVSMSGRSSGSPPVNTLTANTGTLTPTTTSGGTIIWEGSSDSVVITNTATEKNVQLRTTSFALYY